MRNGIMKTNGGGLNMLKDNSQMCLSLSPYQGLYDAIIPQKHLLRRIKGKRWITYRFYNPLNLCDNLYKWKWLYIYSYNYAFRTWHFQSHFFAPCVPAPFKHWKEWFPDGSQTYQTYRSGVVRSDQRVQDQQTNDQRLVRTARHNSQGPLLPYTAAPGHGISNPEKNTFRHAAGKAGDRLSG